MAAMLIIKVIYGYRVELEEKLLEKNFGTEYKDYEKQLGNHYYMFVDDLQDVYFLIDKIHCSAIIMNNINSPIENLFSIGLFAYKKSRMRN